MTEEEFKLNQEKYRCKDCYYYNTDYDCGHCQDDHIICGDFLLDSEEY